MWYVFGAIGALLVVVAVYDLTQRKHAILKNFPIIGHFRYLLESVGPELRQYIVTSNDAERPFSRDQRAWVYSSSKQVNNYSGFGTDNDLDNPSNYLIVKHAAEPAHEPLKGEADYDPKYPIPCAKILGGARQRPKAFRPESPFYVSAMSFGSLSSAAVTAINTGVGIAGGLHNTGEGGIARYHDNGGDLIWQLGTGYFGARDDDGKFSLERVKERAARHNVRAIEIKLSQGAKPGRGGVLPGAKVTPEIAEIRGVPVGKDVISPAYHTAFKGPDQLLDFVESIADATGLPVGIKSAVGEDAFWVELARLMEVGDRGVDFIAIDGGEGGTGAAPLVFADHVSLPFKTGFSRVYKHFHARAVSRTTSCSWAPGDSGSPCRRSSPWRSAATWSAWRARRCCRSAASKRRCVTPGGVPRAWPPRTSGSCAGSTRQTNRPGSRTTWCSCAKRSCGSRTRPENRTRQRSRCRTSRSSTACTEPTARARSSATSRCPSAALRGRRCGGRASALVDFLGLRFVPSRPTPLLVDLQEVPCVEPELLSLWA